jgi:hypothetical protein
VTDNKSPGDRLLELMVFGPTGLAVTLVEEFPKFVEKGRHRVEGQVHTARLLGQFAVQMGRRQLEQSLAHFAGAPDVGVPHGDAEYPDTEYPDTEYPDDTVHHDPARHDAVHHDVADRGPDVPPGGVFPSRRAGDSGGAASPAMPTAPSVWLSGGGPNGSSSASSLAIPGYDSLSASQVVQRLEGLSSSELEEVRAHEAAHRQRRTILHRVEQLLAGDAGPAF